MRRRPTYKEQIEAAARAIAAELIEQQLGGSHFSLPTLNFHIDALLKHRPEIRAEAEKRIQMLTDVASEGMRAIGLDPKPAKPREIDLDDILGKGSVK